MKYCTNCGSLLNEGGDVCLNCGVMVNKVNLPSKKEKKPSKAKAIISMILGICAILYALLSLTALGSIGEAMEEYTIAYKIAFAFGFILIQSILATIALCLACSDKKLNSNTFTTVGFWLSILTFCLACLSVAYIFAYNG